MAFCEASQYLELHRDIQNSKPREGGTWGEYDEVDATTGERFHNAFHLHNYFSNLAELRHKYRTYGHPIRDVDSKTLGQLHDDVYGAIMCAMNRTSTNAKRLFVGGGWTKYLQDGRRVPLLYASEKYLRLHLAELKEAIMDDESKYGETS